MRSGTDVALVKGLCKVIIIYDGDVMRGVWGWLLAFMEQRNRWIVISKIGQTHPVSWLKIIPYPTAFPYGNGMVLHFYQQQESSMTKTVHKVIKKGLKAYV